MKELRLKNGHIAKLHGIKNLSNGWEEAFVQIKLHEKGVYRDTKNFAICGVGALKYIIINGEKIFLNQFTD